MKAKKENKRTDYYHICDQCGGSFHGFIHQTTCWKCIREYLKAVKLV